MQFSEILTGNHQVSRKYSLSYQLLHLSYVYMTADKFQGIESNGPVYVV